MIGIHIDDIKIRIQRPRRRGLVPAFEGVDVVERHRLALNRHTNPASIGQTGRTQGWLTGIQVGI